jgi:uncharacterized membrane protein
MKNRDLKQEITLLILALVPIVYLFINWNALPEQMPIHFDLNGKPNGYGSRYTYLILPLGIYLLMFVLPLIDPKKANYEIFSQSYFKLRLILGIFFGMMTGLIIYNQLHEVQNMKLFTSNLVFFLFMLLGNYLGTIKPNYFVGIKVPWTLNSDEVWAKTHRMAGKLWFWCGLLGVIVSLIFKDGYPILVAVILICSFVPIIYSYVIYQKIAKNIKDQ